MNKLKQIYIYIIATVLTTAIVAAFYPHAETFEYKYEEGKPWNYATLIAPFNVPVYPDSATIAHSRDSLNANFIKVYKEIPGVKDSVLKHYDEAILSNAHALMLNESGNAQYVKRVKDIIAKAYNNQNVVSDDDGEQIIAGNMPSLQLSQGQTISRRTTENLTWPKKIISEIEDNTNTLNPNVVVMFGLDKLIEPNLTIDEDKNSQLYDMEIQRITGAQGMIQSGERIIDKGERVTPQKFLLIQSYEKMLAEQNKDSNRDGLLMVLAQLIYVGALIFILMFYFKSFVSQIYSKTSSVLFILITILVFFLVGMCLEHFIHSGIYIAPLAMVPILMVVFFDARTALFVSVIELFICAPITLYPIEYITIEFFSAVAAVYSLRELSKRSQLLRTAIIVLATSVFTYLVFSLLVNGTFEGVNLRTTIFLVISAVLSSMAYIIMFAAERIFGFVSVVTLVELCDINNPLLRKLSDVCPGTFQHSMTVSTLASDATVRIGGNEQLVRAGALYHDIGKLEHPEYFTENQHGFNPHQNLTPQQSAQCIIAHVTDGLRMADKSALPREVRDFIAQHHGAGMAKYFYITYCNQHPGEDVDPAPFSYPGPNPQTREASVLMMADSVEAASRSLKEHTKESITALVNKIIDAQIAEGLHADSPLSFRDVSLIKDSFISRLMTIYHSRIAYPEKK